MRNRILELRTVHTDELKDNSGNWRLHPAIQRQALRGMAAAVGITDALLAYESEREGGALVLIDGHMRADELPGDWPVLILDLSDAEADLVLATHDSLGAMAEIAGQQLEALMLKLPRPEDAGLARMMADLETRARLTAMQERVEAELEGGKLTESDEGMLALTDQAAKLQEKWQVAYGDIWRCGQHLVMCGDSRNVETWQALLDAADLSKIDGVITSPPYAQQRQQQYGGVEPELYCLWFEPVQANVARFLDREGSFFLNIKPHSENGERVLYCIDLVLAMKRRWRWRYIDELMWRHHGIMGRWPNRLKNQFEPVHHFAKTTKVRVRHDNIVQAFKSDGSGLTAYDGFKTENLTGSPFHEGGKRSREFDGALPGNVINVPAGQGLMPGQPAQFPPAVPRFFIEAFSDRWSVWCDPFSGSGATMEACQVSGRRCLSIEILETYCALSLERALTRFGVVPERLSFVEIPRIDFLAEPQEQGTLAVVLPVPSLGRLEQALAATGEADRGQALMVLCETFLRREREGGKDAK